MVGLTGALLLPSLILGLDKSLFEIVSCQDNEAQLKADSGVETASCEHYAPFCRHSRALSIICCATCKASPVIDGDGEAVPPQVDFIHERKHADDVLEWATPYSLSARDGS